MNKKVLIGGATLAVLLGGAYVFGDGSLMQGSFGGWSAGLPDLELTVDASTPSSDILVLDQDDQRVAVFELTSDTDDYIVEEMALSLKAVVANNISSAYLEYENSDGAIETKTGFFDGAGVASFVGLDVFVGGSDDANVAVYVDLNSVADGATPGERFAVTLRATSAVNQNTGVSGSATSIASTGEIMEVYETKPTLELSSASPYGAHSASVSDEIMIFTVSADDAEKLDVVAVVVDLASTNDFDSAADGDTAYLKNDGLTVSEGTVTVVDDETAYIRFSTAFPFEPFEVSGGDTETLTVVVDTTSLMDVDAGEDDMLTAEIHLGEYNAPRSGFVWNDTNEDVRWVGHVSNSNLTSNTLVY